MKHEPFIRTNLTRLVDISVLVPFLIGATLVLSTLHPLLIRLLVEFPRGAVIIITYIADTYSSAVHHYTLKWIKSSPVHETGAYLWPSARGIGASTKSLSWPALTRRCTLDCSDTDLRGLNNGTASA